MAIVGLVIAIATSPWP